MTRKNKLAIKAQKDNKNSDLPVYQTEEMRMHQKYT